MIDDVRAAILSIFATIGIINVIYFLYTHLQWIN